MSQSEPSAGGAQRRSDKEQLELKDLSREMTADELADVSGGAKVIKPSVGFDTTKNRNKVRHP